VEIVTFAEIQKVKSSFEFKNLISSIQNCNKFQFFEPRFTSLLVPHTDNRLSRSDCLEILTDCSSLLPDQAVVYG